MLTKPFDFFQISTVSDFHRHYLRDNTIGDDFDEYGWLASITTLSVLAVRKKDVSKRRKELPLRKPGIKPTRFLPS